MSTGIQWFLKIHCPIFKFQCFPIVCRSQQLNFDITTQLRLFSTFNRCSTIFANIAARTRGTRKQFYVDLSRITIIIVCNSKCLNIFTRFTIIIRPVVSGAEQFLHNMTDLLPLCKVYWFFILIYYIIAHNLMLYTE